MADTATSYDHSGRPVDVPSDGVKGKTWGPSTCHQRERGEIISRASPDKRWSRSAPHLEKGNPPAAAVALQLHDIDYSSSTGEPEWVSTDSKSSGGYLMPPMQPPHYNGLEPLASRSAARPKMSALETELCNMAAMLAGVGAGFDTRSPIHPRQEEVEERRRWDASRGSTSYLGSDYEFTSSSGYAHNTYHGPTRHYRPLLDTPLRFTDSPQHGAAFSPLPPPHASPRRKSSSVGNEHTADLYPPPGVPVHRSQYSPRPEFYRADSVPYDYAPPAHLGHLHHAYDNPLDVAQAPWTPHRRTPSNQSTTSTSTTNSNVNPSFEGDYPAYGVGNPPRPGAIDRPGTLEVATKLRSSLKRYGRSGSGTTPTNPTPPDSLTSEDSSYVSAASSNRVRFSPITMQTLLDTPVHGQSNDGTVPLQAGLGRRMRRASGDQRKPSITELEHEFLS